MSLRALHTVQAIVAFGYFIPLALFPEWSLPFYGVEVTPGAVQLSRLFGATLVGYGALALQARTLSDASATRAIVNALAIANAVGLVMALVGRLQHVGNGRGWSSVGVYFLFASAYAVFALRKPAPQAAGAA